MIRLFTIALILTCLATGHAAEPKADIELIYRRTRGGKPPDRDFQCNLKIKNNREISVWIIHPSRVDQHLPANGVIPVSYWKPEFFVADGYEIPGRDEAITPGNIGHFVLIHSLVSGEGNSSFHAFLLPAGAEFEFNGYPFSSWKDVDTIEIWEAKDILVNGKTSFSDWFPFDVTASKRVQIKEGTRSNKNMNFDRKTYTTRSDLRQSPVQQMQIEILERYVFPIKPDKINGYP